SLNGKGDFPGQLITKGSIRFGQPISGTLVIGQGDGYTFGGKQGGVVDITMTAQNPSCGTSAGKLDTFLFLFGPPDAMRNRGTVLVRNDVSNFDGGVCNSHIASFTLPRDGSYLIVGSSFLQRGGGAYTLTLTCNNNACADASGEEITFQSSRISQTDI